MSQSTAANPHDAASQAGTASGRRKSVTVEGLAHKFPVPNACRVGPLIVSSAIHPMDPITGAIPQDLPSQCVRLFENAKAIVEAAGGTTADIVKMTFFVRDRNNRGPLNDEWVRMFPDPDARPARHSLLLQADGPSLIQCDFIATVDGTA